MTGPAAGLIDNSEHQRPAYWAAWFIAQYAPRGSTCILSTQVSPDVFIAAFQTATADNIFIVNGTPWPNTVPFAATGLFDFQTVRERKLDPLANNRIQNTNATHTTTQTISFGGSGISVIQFIK